MLDLLYPQSLVNWMEKALVVTILFPDFDQTRKGVGRVRSPKCKYNFTWDTSSVLNYISKICCNDTCLSLRVLSKKLAALLALCSVQRVQTFSKVKTDEILFKEEKVIIDVSCRLETSKPAVGTTMKCPKFSQEG